MKASIKKWFIFIMIFGGVLLSYRECMGYCKEYIDKHNSRSIDQIVEDCRYK